jgi:hypothetical protein
MGVEPLCGHKSAAVLWHGGARTMAESSPEKRYGELSWVGFVAGSGGVGHARQQDQEIDLRWCCELAPMDGWSRDWLKRLR